MTLAESYEPYGSVLTTNGTASSIFAHAGEQIDTYIKLLPTGVLPAAAANVIIGYEQSTVGSRP